MTRYCSLRSSPPEKTRRHLRVLFNSPCVSPGFLVWRSRHVLGRSSFRFWWCILMGSKRLILCFVPLHDPSMTLGDVVHLPPSAVCKCSAFKLSEAEWCGCELLHAEILRENSIILILSYHPSACTRHHHTNHYSNLE